MVNPVDRCAACVGHQPTSRPRLARLLNPLAFGLAACPAFAGTNSSLVLRFENSATGLAVAPDRVEARSATTGEVIARSVVEGLAERALWLPGLPPGKHELRVESPGYFPFSAALVVEDGVQGPASIVLDPLAPPPQFEPARLATRHRAGAMLLAGFVSDAELGAPLTGVEVLAGASGLRTTTDGTGYFELSVPAPAGGTLEGGSLFFTLAGYRALEQSHLELWPGGDWLLQVRLKRGAGTEVSDCRALRRRVGETATPTADAGAPLPARKQPKSEPPPPVRVPRTIRVLKSDGSGVDYVSLETYTKRVLPSEWVASWASFTGGSNSLKAGAVAIRTFGAGYVSTPQMAHYDVCATTSCQVYNPTANNTSANQAVDQTAGYLMLPPGATRIGYKHTEYSAENNALGLTCGDGFTGNSGGCITDAVCGGEARYGHGRGLCQWGSAKWATGLKFPGNSFPLNGSTTNGQPRQDWMWILSHYFPALELVQGTPLVPGDFVQVFGTSSLPVRECPGGTITNGNACALLATKASGATGTLLAGPVQVTSDGFGYTWYRVQWNDATSTLGWSPENWLERATPPAVTPPVLLPLTNRVVTEGQLLTFTASALAPTTMEMPITDFEPFASDTANGTVLFRAPTYSGSTSGLLSNSPSVSQVTGTFPSGLAGSRALRVSWHWNTSAYPWLRLTTASAANLPSPVVDLRRRLEFDLHTDRALRVGLGLRETVLASGTPIGSDGSGSGGIEWAGVTNAVGGQPQCVRRVAPGAWTRVNFDLPVEPVRNFSGGNGTLSTASGLAALEHLAFVPADGAGAYNAYLDNFVVAAPNELTFSLSNAPAGATIDRANGVFTWTPAEGQGPGLYSITVRVTDNNVPPSSDAKTFQVAVNEANQAPTLAAIANRVVHAGTLVIVTNVASDPDLPTNRLSFNLEADAPDGAAVHPDTGVFTWPTDLVAPGSTNAFTVRVTDNGQPPLSTARGFSVAVWPRPHAQATWVVGSTTLTWSALAGTRYRVQYKTALDAPAWTDLPPDVQAAATTATKVDVSTGAQRFYRILVLGW
jgi:hypothetical protein